MRRLIKLGACVLVSSLPSTAWAEQGLDAQDLANLSIEQLAQIHVRSVSKRAEALIDAPASLYVIDHDQIVRSGAATIPEILRLAPNLQVYQSSPSHWIVTARGLNGYPEAQSFSNKLLVLVDGRTVYTPLYSGVYWDMPDLIPDDIERIEVISGPGATLWGANAVNGVINITTRSADAAPGAFAEVEAGSGRQVGGVRISGAAGPDLDYRVYGRVLSEDAFELANSASAKDRWRRLGGGFRLDWTPSEKDSLTLQGDIFDGRENQGDSSHETISGHDIVLRWNRETGAAQQLQLQAFYDHSARATRPDGGSFFVNTYDLDVQHSLALDARNAFVWGGGVRLAHYRIDGTENLFFDPPGRDLFLANLFVQDTFALTDWFSVTGGIKAEHDPYVGTSLLPDVRVAIKPAKSTLLWAAVSHAVRSPTPFDDDVEERVPGVMLSGNRDFRTEKLTSYELGLRSQPSPGLSFSVTGFYHHYDDLRTVELTSGPGLSLTWGNGLEGHTYGLEAWASASPLPWWTLSAGATLMDEGFHFKPGASGIIGTFQNGVDPKHWLTLRSSMNLGSAVLLDLDLRAVGSLQYAAIPAYAELGGRLAWNVSDHVTLSLSGSNLIHDRHAEYPGGDYIPRRVLVGLQLRP